jgi:hypothetical protein
MYFPLNEMEEDFVLIYRALTTPNNFCSQSECAEVVLNRPTDASARLQASRCSRAIMVWSEICKKGTLPDKEYYRTMVIAM